MPTPNRPRASPPRCSDVPRRAAMQLAAAALGTSALGTSSHTLATPALAEESTLRDGPYKSADRSYGPLLQGPFDFPSASRATVRRELSPGRIWSFEQVQGVIYVHVPVRMTVVKLAGTGGLFVYAPVAPTGECLRLLSEIEALHGPVTHILLPTLAIEHKSFAAAFANARPDAVLWVAPSQYSYPIDLPLALQGFPAGTRRLPPPAAAADVPWASELPYLTIGPLREQAGAFEEVVVFDSASRTLLVTDLVVSVPAEPPAILAANDARALLYHARDSPDEESIDTPANRAKGWRKICLFALYFQSSALEVAAEPDGTLSGASAFFSAAFPPEVPASARALGWRGFIAWRWKDTWPASFEQLRQSGRPVVPPILSQIVLGRDAEIVRDFVRLVADTFDFKAIVPAHFDAPVASGRSEWLAAFEPIYGDPRAAAALPPADLAFLLEFERTLVKAGTIRPRPRA